MKARAYDQNLVVHLADYKGAVFPSCVPLMDALEIEGLHTGGPMLSPMFLPKETPLSCMRCIALEVETAAANKADADDV